MIEMIKDARETKLESHKKAEIMNIYESLKEHLDKTKDLFRMNELLRSS